MSLFVQGLRALRRALPTLPLKTPEFRDLTMEWLGDLSTFDPAARELWPKIKDGFEGRKVLFREVYPSSKPGVPPFTFGDETVFDCFHAFANSGEAVSTGPEFPPFLGAVPSPTDEAHRRWSLLSQHISLHPPFAQATQHDPNDLRPPRTAGVGAGLQPSGTGRREGCPPRISRAELISKYPTLKGWVEPLRESAVGNEAGTLRGGTPLVTSKTTTCSCEFCGNCDGAAEKINLALSCDLVDLAPLLGKAGLHPLLIGYTTNTQRVLLGPTTYERIVEATLDRKKIKPDDGNSAPPSFEMNEVWTDDIDRDSMEKNQVESRAEPVEDISQGVWERAECSCNEMWTRQISED
ncbi:hypothetical protein B0H13DRAFT_1894707 [Mycena leptocephala]|nr:hypothetical protein B0H13DRAFT_1894707 [Mycena leptocephala]